MHTAASPAQSSQNKAESELLSDLAKHAECIIDGDKARARVLYSYDYDYH